MPVGADIIPLHQPERGLEVEPGIEVPGDDVAGGCRRAADRHPVPSWFHHNAEEVRQGLAACEVGPHLVPLDEP